MRRPILALLTLFGLFVPGVANAAPAAPPEMVTICHSPGTPAEKTLTLPRPAADAHIEHGDRLGHCQSGIPCDVPPPPPEPEPGTDPDEGGPALISEAVATLVGAGERGFYPAGAPITFQLSCPTLQLGPDTVIVYNNGIPISYESLTLTSDSVTLPSGISSGRHSLNLVAQDVFGYLIDATFVVWAGQFTVPVLVLDENGTPEAGTPVVAKLGDDPTVSAQLTTDAAGRGAFPNLPNRSYNIIAQTSDNRFATQPTSVFDGTAVLRLQGFKPASPIDNNDFSQGTAGWDVGTAPVAIVQHVDDLQEASPASTVPPEAPTRTPEASDEADVFLQRTAEFDPTDTDLDLALTTSGEGQQSISRTFAVEAGTNSVTVRYRFITSEVPGGWFGSEFNDLYNVTIRSTQIGSSVIDGNSMNGLGLAAFDSGGATDWFESELPVNDQGDTVQVNIAVANVADALFNSRVVVDVVKKKKLMVSAVQLNDIDADQVRRLSFLSASNHSYFGGNTRVHGTITIQGAREDTLEELTVEVLEGRRIAIGTLPTSLRETLLTQFGDDETIRLSASQLLFEIPGAQLAAANQSTNGRLTLRVKARSSSGETAEKDAGSIQKLVRVTGISRYGLDRDLNEGGDDWAKPAVRAFITSVAPGLSWNDYSNMNGGYTPDHSSHRTGNDADGRFAGYLARDAATAATIIGHLNTYGTRIQMVFVTFTPAFAGAIANIVLNDGRRATDVIRNIVNHVDHFHWRMTD